MANRRTSESKKRMSGTLRSGRAVPAIEPSPVPIMPSWLSERAQQLWRAKAQTLADLGLLGPLDVEGFGVWCCTQATIEEQIAKGGAPSRDLLTTVRSLASRYGLDPDSRARILGTPPKPTRRHDHYGFDDLDE